ncbi:MAG TPA: SUKH-3 domain-containing protein [Steroidobacter sp.]|uniref:SUKH-3 domain-containing protein n=1 Tax=Steroidobacter sp. TaxID=1978227 RepID=UPI002ED90FED
MQDKTASPPLSIRSLFERAGWSPARQVQVSARVPIGHPARAILCSFTGLRVGESGPGVDCAASDIAFRDEDSEFETEWSPHLGSQLICVGGLHNEHGELFIDSRGRVFGASLIHDAFWFEGADVWTGIEGALLGRRSRPVLHPTQDAVTLYGERYARGDPRIYLP